MKLNSRYLGYHSPTPHLTDNLTVQACNTATGSPDCGGARTKAGQSLWIGGLNFTVWSINASFPFAVNALPLLMRWYSHQCISRVFDKIKLILCKKFLWFFEMKRLKRQINRIIFKIGQFVHYGSSVCIFLRLSLRSVEITMDLWGDI